MQQPGTTLSGNLKIKTYSAKRVCSDMLIFGLVALKLLQL